jgi:carboxyl-terminal processing protease
MKRFLVGIYTGILVVLVFLSGYWLGQSSFAPVRLSSTDAPTGVAGEDVEPLWEVWTLVQERFFAQPVNNTALMEGAIEGLLATLDDENTRYLDPAAEESDRMRMEGELQGIGAEVTSEDGAITIVTPIEGSPAAAAGLRPGDILLAADGVELTGMDVGEAASLVRGPAGTIVTLTVERDGEVFELEVVRDVIKLASVRSRMLDDGIAYVRINRFAFPTADELEAALESVLAEEPSGMVLDLRMNGGGLRDAVIDVADQFLPEGIVMIERFGNGEELIYRSTDSGMAETVPLVVLVDEGSASAAEVLAGALRDRDRAILIGEQTFGKGTIQSVHELSNGGGLRLTVARWLTPNETWVHQEGLTPDQEVAFDGLPDSSGDTQLEAALDYLSSNAQGR